MICLRALGPLLLVTITLMMTSLVSFHYQAAFRTPVSGRAVW